MYGQSHAQSCDTIYGVTSTNQIQWIHTATGNTGTKGTVGGVNAFCANYDLGVFYAGDGKNVYWYDIVSGATGLLGTFNAFNGTLESGGGAYLNGHIYLATEVGGAATDIYRVELSGDGKSAVPANTGTNITNGNNFDGNYGDIAVFGSVGAEVIYGSTFKDPNNEIWKFDVSTQQTTFIKTYNEFAAYQLGVDYLGVLWGHNSADNSLFVLNKNTGNKSNNKSLGSARFNDMGGYFCYATSQILPVELLYFSADLHGAGILLSWSTASEINTAYFEIQKSSDAKSWEHVAQVEAEGAENIGMHYEFLDAGLFTSANAYYRLKMVDFDGFTEYSSIQWVATGGQIEPSVMPNPFKDQLIVQFPIAELQTTYQLTNQLGIPVLQGIIERSKTLISTKNIAPGYYYLTLNNAQQQWSFAVIKQ